MEFHLKTITHQLQEFYDEYGDDLTDAHDSQLGSIIKQLNSIEFRTSAPLLVLDLNGVLIETEFVPDMSIEKEGWGRIGKSLRRARPCADELFDNLFLQNHQIRVAIWSSSYLSNVKKTIDLLFPQWRNRFVFVWGQEQCESQSNPDHNPDDKKSKPMLFWKNVSKIMKEFPQYSMENILIVDDYLQKLEKNSKENILVLTGGSSPLDEIYNHPWNKGKMNRSPVGESNTN